MGQEGGSFKSSAVVSLGFQDVREGVTLQKATLRKL